MNGEGYSPDQAVRYTAPTTAQLAASATDGRIWLAGTWRPRPEYLLAEKNARVLLPFFAQNVYMVAAAKAPVRVSLLLDGKPLGGLAGADARGGSVSVDRSDLYWLVRLARPGRHVLEIDADRGFQLFTFTFGWMRIR